MEWPLTVAALGEGVTGLALLVAPSLVARLLLGDDLVGIAVPVARILGIALMALGVAGWPGPARLGMLLYGGAATIYLTYLGLIGVGGVLLWPAVVLHLALVILLLRQPSINAVSAGGGTDNEESLR